MIRFYTLLVSFAFLWNANAQNYNFIENESDNPDSSKEFLESSVQLGTQASFSSNKSTYLSNYILPSISYDANERLTLKVGIGVYHTLFNNVPTLMNERTLTTMNGKYSSIFGYALGVYKINQNLNLIGGYSFSETIPNNDTPILNQSFKQANVGFNYKFSSGISVGAQVGFNNNPYMGLGGINNGFVQNGPMNYIFP